MTTYAQDRDEAGVASDVPGDFDGVASTYDLMVALNPGYHRHLRASADALVAGLRTPVDEPVRVLDLGCGSGASTKALEGALRASGRAHELVGVDGSAGMLARARSKRWAGRVRFEQRDAELLATVPIDPPDDDGAPATYDAIFAAYLLRNIGDRDRLLSTLHGLLAPGGVLVVHEYSVRGDRLAAALWTLVCWTVVIPLGVLTAPRSGIYRYLWRSVVDMDSTAQVRARFAAAGFTSVADATFGGWQRGVLHTFVGRRPAEPTASSEPSTSGTP